MEVKKDSWLKIGWRLFYPLLIYLGVTAVVSFLTCFGLTIKVLTDAASTEGFNMAQQMQALINRVMELYLRLTYYLTVASALITIPILYLFFRQDKKKRIALGTEIVYCKASVMEYVLLALVAFGACIGGNNVILGIGLAEIDTSYQEVSQILYSASLPVQFVGTVLIAPLCEELIFRGLIYNRMKEYVPLKTAMLLQAFAFGLYHGNLVQLLYAFFLGYLMAYVYEKYHSFWAAFLFHAVANGVSVLITETAIFDFLYMNRMMMLLSGILGVAVVVVGVRMMNDTVKLEPKDPVSKVEL